ncbi:hypothetical protein CSHISOI_07262 [Colletotrichum shisoi]|uniref:Uncharacterized protein n=1 Tax=Colletotrichum shisoi TaxID=2078593 RepID=A0A5Q4BLM8_9PEZI|nr:hypothetical protein CSHISOI_07262 [Colletotrichum shisoi]
MNTTAELCREVLFFQYVKEHVVSILDVKHDEDLSKCVGRKKADWTGWSAYVAVEQILEHPPSDSDWRELDEHGSHVLDQLALSDFTYEDNTSRATNMRTVEKLTESLSGQVALLHMDLDDHIEHTSDQPPAGSSYESNWNRCHVFEEIWPEIY